MNEDDKKDDAESTLDVRDSATVEPEQNEIAKQHVQEGTVDDPYPYRGVTGPTGPYPYGEPGSGWTSSFTGAWGPTGAIGPTGPIGPPGDPIGHKGAMGEPGDMTSRPTTPDMPSFSDDYDNDSSE